jgi:hypothetical protein
MEVLPLVTEMLVKVEIRNQRHPMRLYGTLARGAVWSCMNRVSWALPDLARVLRWGVARGLIERAEARRMWMLVRMLVEPGAAVVPPPPSGPPDASVPVGLHGDHGLDTRLHVLHGFARPWQEWATEKINRNQGG